MTAPADDRFPPPEIGVDEVVRAQLDAEAAGVDAAGMWNRVLARLHADAAPTEPARPRGGSVRRIVMGAMVAGMAAALLVGVFLAGGPAVAMATPAEVVEAARASYARDTDRCYTQTVSLAPDAPARLAHVADAGRTATLCTRGDRFVVEPGFGGRGAWGRDEHGRVWVAPTRDAALRFDEADLPPGLRDAAKIRGLELDTLLGDVLKDFDLAWAEPPARGAGTVSITATPRGPGGPRGLRSATIVVEKETDLIRSLALRRQLPGGDPVTVTFTFEGAAEKDPLIYSAEGHIDAGRPVYDRSRAGARLRILRQRLGDAFAGGP